MRGAWHVDQEPIRSPSAEFLLPAACLPGQLLSRSLLVLVAGGGSASRSGRGMGAVHPELVPRESRIGRPTSQARATVLRAGSGIHQPCILLSVHSASI